MENLKTSDLYSQNNSEVFYENRYEQGYMEEWPIEKKRKIQEIIKELNLPTQGEALDFGCGNGVLTEVIRQSLPSWKVFGTDLSKKAIANATRMYPNCTFFDATNSELNSKKFDFIFTHHVFEHVFDLNEVFRNMNKYLKPKSSMLHFLPCGNEGSYEHSICLLRKDGINKELENRFFFEDEGHVRRLTTDKFKKLCQSINFELQNEFYSNQYFGAIDWITNSNHKFVIMFSDPSNAISNEARKKMKYERRKLLVITAFRLPAQVATKILMKKNKRLKHYIMFLMSLPFLIFSKPIDNYYKRKAKEEWEQRKHDRNGSEMALYFKRE